MNFEGLIYKDCQWAIGEEVQLKKDDGTWTSATIKQVWSDKRTGFTMTVFSKEVGTKEITRASIGSIRKQFYAQTVSVQSYIAKLPIRICVTGAAGLISYSLIPQIAMGACFGPDQPVIIHMLDIEPCKQGLNGLAMELEDMCNPLLKGVVATTDPKVAFKDVDYAILCGAFPRKQGMERSDLLAKNAGIFKEQGLAIKEVGKRDMKVLVVGNPANTNAMLLQHFSGLPKMNVHAMTRLDHNRARNMLARKIGDGAMGHEIKNLIIWGNHSPTMYPDVRHATYKGKKLVNLLPKDWLEGEFITEVAQRGTAVIKVRGASSATSAGRGALDHVHDWFLGNTNEWCSCGVYSDGTKYGIPEGVIYSVPCQCLGGGVISIVKGLAIDEFSKQKMKITADELVEEKKLAMDSL